MKMPCTLTVNIAKNGAVTIASFVCANALWQKRWQNGELRLQVSVSIAGRKEKGDDDKHENGRVELSGEIDYTGGTKSIDYPARPDDYHGAMFYCGEKNFETTIVKIPPQIKFETKLPV